MIELRRRVIIFDHKDYPSYLLGYVWVQMEATLRIRYQVIFYSDNGREVYYPASNDSALLADKLREARAKGLHAWLSQMD